MQLRDRLEFEYENHRMPAVTVHGVSIAFSGRQPITACLPIPRRLVIVLDLLRPAPPKTLEEAWSQIDGLWVIVIELKKQNDKLRGEVRELGERIGKSSRNSSRAASSDSTSQRFKWPNKPKSQKRQGAQPGHEKHERPIVCEGEVDKIPRSVPTAVCGCGGSVAIEHKPRCRHQVFNIAAGDSIEVDVVRADDYDLYGSIVG